MTQHTATSTSKVISGLAATAMAVAAFAASAMGSAPAAHATCASFFGLGNGNGCTSSFGNIAIAIGTGATAQAEGFFTTAFAAGTDSRALIFGGSSFFSSATALGNGGVAASLGIAQTAFALGNGSDALAGTTDGSPPAGFPNPFGDFAINVANNAGTHFSEAIAIGYGTIATNLGAVNSSVTEAIGTLNSAVNLFGTANEAAAANFTDPNNLPGAFANFAFTVFGSHSFAEAGGGPFAIAGSIGQTNQTVTKQGPGFNINGVKVGGGAAPAKAAAVGSSKKGITGSAAAIKHISKK
jgi:hypothetical protein